MTGESYAVGGLVLAITTAAWICAYLKAEAARRNRLRGRAVLTFDEWFMKYYASSGIPKAVAQAILESLALAVGAKPTQLSPTDRFAVELALAGSRCLLDDSLDDFESDLHRIAARHGTEIDWSWLRKCNTVDDLIRCIGTGRSPGSV